MASVFNPPPVDALPVEFLAKDNRTYDLRWLEPAQRSALIDRYLAFQPRGSFQGLPPLKDEACVRWVEEMFRTGKHIAAWSGALEGAREIAGHLALFPLNDGTCEMLVVVWPEYQNVGIGTALTRTCVAVARQRRYERLWLAVDTTNVRAKHIYVKCGFRRTSRRMSREVDMVCDLGPAYLDYFEDSAADACGGFSARASTAANTSSTAAP